MLKKPLVFLFITVCSLLNQASFAGAYSGIEADHNDTSLYFVGAQTDTLVILSVFIGDLEYLYKDALDDVVVESSIISPMLGYKFDGDISYTISAGITVTEETENRNTQTVSSRSTGAVFQFTISHFNTNNNTNFILSYNDVTEFIWSRARTKTQLHAEYFLGAEAFSMGNDNFKSQGIALLFEKTGNILSGLLKIGVSDIDDVGSGVYGGIEVGIPF